MPNFNYKNAKGGQMMINRLYTIERVARGLRQEINPNNHNAFKNLKWWQKIGVWSAVYTISVESLGFIGKKIGE